MAGTRISVRIDEDLRQRLAKEAASTGKPESEIVRQALRDKLKRKGRKPTCYDLAREAGLIGVIKNAPRDLSTNRKYFEGFGE